MHDHARNDPATRDPATRDHATHGHATSDPATHPSGAPVRRRAARFPAELPVSWSRGRGTTRNLSAVGIYFVTEEPLGTDSSVEFTVLFDTGDPNGGVSLRCRGRVVRVDERDRETGVAVDVESYFFDEPSRDRSRPTDLRTGWDR